MFDLDLGWFLTSSSSGHCFCLCSLKFPDMTPNPICWYFRFKCYLQLRFRYYQNGGLTKPYVPPAKDGGLTAEPKGVVALGQQRSKGSQFFGYLLFFRTQFQKHILQSRIFTGRVEPPTPLCLGLNKKLLYIDYEK